MGYKTVNKSNLPMIDYRELVPLQGNLKDLTKANYQKLLKSIEKEGFFVPAFVWFNDGVPYILDAHQRHRVLTNENIEFENSGFEIPYIEIEAIDEADAAEKLLKISSQYATITQEGIDEFMATYELNEAEVYEATSYDAIKVYGSDIEEPEIDLPSGDKDGFQQITFTLSDQQADEVKQAVANAKQHITGDEINENSNGNALYHIARLFNERS